jgi:hypothetical protein
MSHRNQLSSLPLPPPATGCRPEENVGEIIKKLGTSLFPPSAPLSAFCTLTPASLPLSALHLHLNASPSQRSAPSILRLPLSVLYTLDPAPPPLSLTPSTHLPSQRSTHLFQHLPHSVWNLTPVPPRLSGLHPHSIASPSQPQLSTPSLQGLPLSALYTLNPAISSPSALLPQSSASSPQRFTVLPHSSASLPQCPTLISPDTFPCPQGA